MLEWCVVEWLQLSDPTALLPCGMSDCIVVLSMNMEDPGEFGVAVESTAEHVNDGMCACSRVFGCLCFACLLHCIGSQLPEVSGHRTKLLTHPPLPFEVFRSLATAIWVRFLMH